MEPWTRRGPAGRSTVAIWTGGGSTASVATAASVSTGSGGGASSAALASATSLDVTWVESSSYAATGGSLAVGSADPGAPPTFGSRGSGPTGSIAPSDSLAQPSGLLTGRPFGASGQRSGSASH